ncbi:MAG: DinB family protein [Crocinitomicaceae bacterium]
MRIRSGEHLISEVRRVAEHALQFGETELNGLTSEQLNFRPKGGAWSINQVLAHINSFSSYYNKAFKERIEKTRHDHPKEKYVSSPLGLAQIKSMKLGKMNNVRRKLKSPRMHNPAIHPVLEEGDQVKKFMEYQKEMFEISEEAAEVNLRRTKIPLAISNRIKLRLGDALIYVSYHVERHLQQIKNIKLDPKYPGK